MIAAVAAQTGCTRTFWRGRADREVAYLVAEKSNNPRWALPPGFNLNMDPRSRYYDPTNPDRPPLPPDDPYSHVYMHHVDGKRHAPWWHRNGELPGLANPGWRQRLGEYCETTPEGVVKLDLPGAVALSYIHSPLHRTQLETLYLSALDVSTERFRFNTQLFAGSGVTWLRSGAQSANARVVGGTPISRSQLTVLNSGPVGTNTVLSRQFATGADLLVGFANSFVWQLAGPETNNANSLVNMSLVQPLLRAGGRIVTLEQLTIVERTLLANLRAYERWRHGWFSNVAVGQTQGVQSLSRRGGGFGGTGLTGFSGQGIGGLGGVAAAINFGGAQVGGSGQVGGTSAAGVAGLATGGAGTVGGFIGLLQQKQQIANAENTLNLQTRTLQLLEANLEAGLIDIAQVDIFRQSIESARANLLNAKIGFANSQDGFKAGQLGLPPDLPIEIDDSMIRPFQLVDPELNELQTRFAEFIDRLSKVEGDPTEQQLAEAIARLSELHRQIGEAIAGAREDLKTLEGRSDTRVRRMTPEERTLFVAEKQRLADNLSEFEIRFEQDQPRLEAVRADLGPETRGETANALVALATSFSGLTQEISLVKALARLESVTLEPLELSTIDALQIARVHRLDWMNARASLVDQWRLIAFNANALRSNLTVTINGNMSTLGNNPLRFESATGNFTAGLRFDAPITRLLERNNYRQALIQYQQQRRALIQFEDLQNQGLRQDLRILKQLEINLEIQRRAVAIAIRRVDQTREALSQPPAPVQPGQPASTLGPTSAQNLLSALQALSDSQNNFMSVWLQYYANRLETYIDLGIMRLDDRGMWIDEPLDKNLAELDAMYPLPPELPVDWLRDVGLDPNAPPVGVPNEGVPTLGDRVPPENPEAVEPSMELPNPGEGPAPALDETSTPLFAPPAPQEAADESALKRTLRKLLFRKSKSPAEEQAAGEPLEAGARS
jgi:hypothetical protein